MILIQISCESGLYFSHSVQMIELLFNYKNSSSSIIVLAELIILFKNVLKL